MNKWIQQFKEKLKQYNEKIDLYATSKKTSKLRITLGVLWNLSLVFFIMLFIGTIFVFSIGVGYFVSLVKDEPLHTKEEMRKQEEKLQNIKGE